MQRPSAPPPTFFSSPTAAAAPTRSARFVFPDLAAYQQDPPQPDSDTDSEDAQLALRLQRQFEAEMESLTLDETLAYSLILDDARASSVDSNSAKKADGKPPPACSCCLSPIEAVGSRRVMPCGHLYCLQCIKTRCVMGVRDRSLVPAHCCKREFPSDYVKEALAVKDWQAYERFVDEKNWVGNGLELASDKEYAAMIKQRGWKQCPTCGVGVEKISGCEAVQCLRGHHFCFMCGRARGGDAPCTCGTATLRTHGFR